MALRIVFFGSDPLGLPTLEALMAEGLIPEAIVTQPPKAKGRGQLFQKTPIHLWGEQRDIPVHTPVKLRLWEGAGPLLKDIDIAVLVAYGQLIPSEFLRLPRFGFLNLHPSLLPRWRGSTPIQRALEAGDEETGVCIMQLDEGMDTGPLYSCIHVPIFKGETAGILTQRLARLGAAEMIKVVKTVDGKVPAPQPASGATLAPKFTPTEGEIQWTQPAARIVCKIHAFSPVPGAYTELNGVRLKIYKAEEVEGPYTDPPGTLREGVFVAGDGKGVRPLDLQRPGGQVMDGAAFFRGFRTDSKRSEPLSHPQ